MANFVVAKCDYDYAVQFKGKVITAKFENKKYRVLLRVRCDDLTLLDAIELAKKSKNIVMLEYQGTGDSMQYSALTPNMVGNVYIGRIVEFGNNISDEDIEGVLEDTPETVTPILKLPDDFSNLELVWKLCKKYEKVRFCGGCLFSIDGVRIGCCGSDILEKSGIKAQNESLFKPDCACCCALKVTDFEKLDEIELSDKPEKTSSTKSSSSGGKKQKTLLFSSLMSTGAVEL